jgi:hypothetical protein
MEPASWCSTLPSKGVSDQQAVVNSLSCQMANLQDSIWNLENKQYGKRDTPGNPNTSNTGNGSEVDFLRGLITSGKSFVSDSGSHTNDNSREAIHRIEVKLAEVAGGASRSGDFQVACHIDQLSQRVANLEVRSLHKGRGQMEW